jgi:hypothetical protein
MRHRQEYYADLVNEFIEITEAEANEIVERIRATVPARATASHPLPIGPQYSHHITLSGILI